MAIQKTFFFLRISKTLGYLVTLVRSVMVGLGTFMLFYVVITHIFTLIFATIGFQNFTKRENLATVLGTDTPDALAIEEGDAPGVEYTVWGDDLGMAMNDFLSMIRYSMGDFEYGWVAYIADPEIAAIYWAIWFGQTYLNCIIMFNFIIAEAGKFHAMVMENVDRLLQLERVTLVNESEDMYPESFKRNPTYYPKFLIVRQIET